MRGSAGKSVQQHYWKNPNSFPYFLSSSRRQASDDCYFHPAVPYGTADGRYVDSAARYFSSDGCYVLSAKSYGDSDGRYVDSDKC
jgi:hypothetical protein